MKVIFMPDYRNNNSYQANLSNSLLEQGVKVNFSDSGIFNIMKNIKMYWKPDILHIHWPNQSMKSKNKFYTFLKSTSFICIIFLLRLSGIKIIWTVHNISEHDTKFKSTEMFFNTILAKLCNRLIVHCTSAKNEVLKNYKGIEDNLIAIIPHGNYIRLYKNTLTMSDSRRKLNISEDEIVFLYFGQIRPYKGIIELVNSFKRLNHDKSKLLIVGKPIDKQITMDILEDCKNTNNIKNILEFIPDNDIQIYMNAADVVVLPYKDILTSGALLLAMSFGKPVIAPNIGCITDILDDKGGILYKKDDDELFEAMQSVLNIDKLSLVNMSKHNFELAERFKWGEIGIKTNSIYQECINHK